MKKVSFLFMILIMMISLTSCNKGKEINLSYDKDEIEISVGDKISVKPKVELGKKVKDYILEYKLSNNLATVDGEGNLVAREAGTTTLTVTANNKKKSSVTLKIIIVEAGYVINFDANGGILQENKLVFEDATNVILPIPTKEGTTFIGWYEEDKLVETLENRNYNLVAKYEIITYKITYIAFGATLPADATKNFTDGSKVKLPIPTKDGYNFIGWYEEDQLVETLENRNYTLTAKFEKIDDGNYTISYMFTEGE